MARIAYLDCFSGISGDMLLGAIIDSGLWRAEDLAEQIRKAVPSGWRLDAQKVVKGELSATSVTVHVTGPQPERRLGDILTLIGKSTLPPAVKEKAAQAFRLLAQAEASVHGATPESVHFHEVGALDAIVDVVGSVVGLHLLGAIEPDSPRRPINERMAVVEVDRVEMPRVYCSPLPLGSGSVKTQAGILPVPAPAVVELVKGIPTVAGPAQTELTTPTGAAIARAVCEGFGPMPDMSIERVGYGAGKKDLPAPNVLRLIVGQAEGSRAEERLALLETNIDDMSPQVYEHVMNLLFAAGALDVFLTPVIMKKGRPGTLVTALADPAKEPALLEVLFRETTTLGVRISDVRRRKVEREVIEVETQWGAIRVKMGGVGEGRTIQPEYEDCRQAAEQSGASLMEVQQAARSAALKMLSERDG